MSIITPPDYTLPFAYETMSPIKLELWKDIEHKGIMLSPSYGGVKPGKLPQPLYAFQGGVREGIDGIMWITFNVLQITGNEVVVISNGVQNYT